MSGLAASMESGSELTDMEILARLLRKEAIELHTTIHNPIAMSGLDQGLVLIKHEFGKEMHTFAKSWVVWYRANMVAEDGNRAKGILNAVAAKKEEQKKKSMMERQLGDLSK